MQKLVTITITHTAEVTIPDNIIPELLNDYRDTINEVSNESTLFKTAAMGYCVDGESEFIEGIGNLKEQGIEIVRTDTSYDFDLEDL
ncbi:hypothetical protein [Leptospira santarosai]|uniref:hypothetical protein n=1 Tax=Leptospira santarosai TaxID=28183 RepID=UPI0026E42969|nr:hypothetical protein [Leptospira santarosai]MDO6383356.1 hypothetical protein [Leptospira santarosai]